MGHVAFNWEATTHRTLASGDEIRVVDTFFRFLCDRELRERFHETIYHMTIFDMPTGLANSRYLREVVEREVSRAAKVGAPLSIVTLQLEPPPEGVPQRSHDSVRTVAAKIRSGIPADWFVARGGELEVVVAALDAPLEDVERKAHECQRACNTTPRATALGIAELGGHIQDATALLAAARANASR